MCGVIVSDLRSVAISQCRPFPSEFILLAFLADKSEEKKKDGREKILDLRVGKANYALREAEGDKWKSSINAGCHYQSICSG